MKCRDLAIHLTCIITWSMKACLCVIFVCYCLYYHCLIVEILQSVIVFEVICVHWMWRQNINAIGCMTSLFQLRAELTWTCFAICVWQTQRILVRASRTADTFPDVTVCPHHKHIDTTCTWCRMQISYSTSWCRKMSVFVDKVRIIWPDILFKAIPQDARVLPGTHNKFWKFE